MLGSNDVLDDSFRECIVELTNAHCEPGYKSTVPLVTQIAIAWSRLIDVVVIPESELDFIGIFSKVTHFVELCHAAFQMHRSVICAVRLKIVSHHIREE
jgi:hypothetical protein